MGKHGRYVLVPSPQASDEATGVQTSSETIQYDGMSTDTCIVQFDWDRFSVSALVKSWRRGQPLGLQQRRHYIL